MSQSTASIRYLKDKDDEVFFPVAHEKGVVDSSGTTLETKLGQKQDTLVSGTSIKTINNESILGSGNITVQTSITTDATPTSGSTNPVQSGGVFTALSGKQQTISTVNVTVDNNTGTPSATASVSGGTMTMAFSNLKGAKGDTGATGATGATGPQGPKGDQGNPGSSVDYPFTLANNLTTNDSTVALAAPQGKYLGEKLFGIQSNYTAGYYINSSNELKVDANYAVSDYIPAPTARFTVFYSASSSLQGKYLCFLNDSDEVVGYKHLNVVSGTAVDPPSGATKFRFSFEINYAAYAAYGGVNIYTKQDAVAGIEEKILPIPTMQSDIEAIKEQMPNKADLETIIGTNLFDKSKVLVGSYIGTGDGVVHNDYAGAVLSPLIEVTPGNTYRLERSASLTVNAFRCVASDGITPIQALQQDGVTPWLYSGTQTAVVVIPSNAKYFQFQVEWDSQGRDTAQFQKGQYFTGYEPYEEHHLVPYSEMPEEVTAAVGIVGSAESMVNLNMEVGGESTITSPFTSGASFRQHFKVKRAMSATLNPCFNFESAGIVVDASQVETEVHYASDDIAPIWFKNGAEQLGANHGVFGLTLCTSSSHGKTVADIGSTWNNGTYNYTIVGIYDADHLLLLGDNSLTYPKFSFRSVTTGTYTHQNGATHTSTFQVSAVSVMQWWSAFATPEQHIYINGQEVSNSGKYASKELKVCEVYDIPNPASVLAVVKSNVGNYTENPMPGNVPADKMCRLTITYTFTNATECIVATSINFFQAVNFSNFGTIQQNHLSGNNAKIYIPKAKSKNGGANAVDYRTVVNLSDAPGSILAADWEVPTLPPDRWVEFTDLVAFSGGYIYDLGDGGEKRLAAIANGEAMYISNSEKCYPVSCSSNDSIIGQNHGIVAWRKYIDRTVINTGGVIAKNIIVYGNDCYIYADFKAQGTYQIDIPGKFAGREVKVLEARSNVSLLTSIASSSITINVGAGSPMYGYFVAKISL